MAEDLFTRIQRELQERIEELHGAVKERDRLQVELSALDVTLETPSRPALAAVPEIDPEPSAAVLCFPGRREPARAPAGSPAAGRPMPAPARPLRRRAVSPKVARLMLAPRRPALERPGIARVGGRVGRADDSPEELLDELDPDAELFERSIGA